jgi:hypothetical protein
VQTSGAYGVVREGAGNYFVVFTKDDVTKCVPVATAVYGPSRMGYAMVGVYVQVATYLDSPALFNKYGIGTNGVSVGLQEIAQNPDGSFFYRDDDVPFNLQMAC